MKILAILLITAVFLFGLKLTKSGDYVIDDKNKLMWQDHQDNKRVIVTQDHAIEYCEKLTLNGFSDWRVPTIKNYKLIIDLKRRAELKINRAFRHKLPEEYWTSDRTWIRNLGQYGYFVYFKSGAIYYQNRTYPMYVRCVRDMK